MNSENAKWAKPERKLGGVYEPKPLTAPVFTPNPIPVKRVEVPERELVPLTPKKQR